MRAFLYVNLDPGFSPAALLSGAKDAVDQPDRLQALIDQIRKQPQNLVRTIHWNSDAASAETFHAMPLTGRNNELLGVLLVGSSRRGMVLLTERIVAIAAAVTAAALF